MLAGLCLAGYWPSFSGRFFLDDYSNIVENPYVRIKDLRPKTLISAAFQDFKQNRPLSNLSLALNYYFNGQDPFGYHLVNFLLHLFTAAGVWLLLRRLFLRLGFEHRRSELAAWLSALVWATDPLHTQAVAYMVQRQLLMAAGFYVWTLYFYHRGLESNRNRRLLLVGAGFLCALAILSKEIALTLPAMVLAWKVYFFDRLEPGWLRQNRKWIMALGVFYLLLAAFAFRPGMREVVFNFGRYNFGAREKILSQPRVWLWDFFIIIFPFPQFLSVKHSFPVSHSFFNPASTIPAWVLIAGLMVLAAVRARKNRLVSFAMVWYFGVLLVESLPLPIQLVLEHRLYLASLGIIAPAVSYPVLKLKRVRPALLTLLILAALFTGLSHLRCRVWRNEQSLWKDALKKSPTAISSWVSYCEALSVAGQCREAASVCAVAGATPNSHLNAQLFLADCYLRTGENGPAKNELLALAGKYPSLPAAVYLNLGMICSREKDYPNAIAWYFQAIAREPKNFSAHYQLAQAYARTDNQAGFISELSQALELSPASRPARLELARALAQKGDCAGAVKLIRNAPVSSAEFSPILEFCKGK